MPSQIKYVLLTGATGFIGAHVLDELLRRGLRVRCTARSYKNAEKMIRDRPQFKDQFDFVFVRDLINPDVFDEAVKGVDAIIHTASKPVYYDVKDNEKELMLPAINGTKSILSAAKSEPSVQRIVFTSSFATVLDRSKGARPGYTYTAADWNPITYDEGRAPGAEPIAGYRAGKKYAELAAWECIRDDRPHFDLVTLCPPMVFGPVVHPVARVEDLNDSNADLWSITHCDPLPVPRVPCWVDVRDLAYAHAEALVRPEVSNRRYTIAAPEHFTYQRAADIARSHFDWARTVVTKGNEGEPLSGAFYVDGEAAKRDLGVTYRSFKECVVDSISQFREIQLQED